MVDKVLLFGSGGRVGSALTAYMKDRVKLIFPSTRAYCHLGDTETVRAHLDEINPTHVINCAAISSLEGCLDHPEAAMRLNAEAPEIMAQWCSERQARFVHISTDYVLAGERPGLKKEEDPCAPINVYGKSKLEAEKLVSAAYPESVIVRVSWVFGNPKKPAFPEMILKKAVKGESLAAISDKWSLPTCTNDLSAALSQLALDKQISGVVQFCQSGEPISWYDYAQLILERAKHYGLIERIPEVAEQKLDEMTCFRDARPVHTAMSTEKVANLLGRVPRSVDEVIDSTVAYYAENPSLFLI